MVKKTPAAAASPVRTRGKPTCGAKRIPPTLATRCHWRRESSSTLNKSFSAVRFYFTLVPKLHPITRLSEFPDIVLKYISPVPVKLSGCFSIFTSVLPPDPPTIREMIPKNGSAETMAPLSSNNYVLTFIKYIIIKYDALINTLMIVVPLYIHSI
jgi:hypothetical protein